MWEGYVYAGHGAFVSLGSTEAIDGRGRGGDSLEGRGSQPLQ